MKLAVVIPSWNGCELLHDHLPAVLAACAGYGDAEVVVVDDGSSDGTPDRLAREFPGVRVVARPRNGGFGAAANDGVAAAGGEVVVCLNNDVRPEPGFLTPLAEALAGDPDLFAAVPRTLNLRHGGDEARTAATFRRGLIDVVFPDRSGLATPGAPAPILYPCGGAAAYRRDRFLALGGFRRLYHPYYWEDVDLGWRARRRGWGALHVPAACVHHLGGATIGRHAPAGQVKAVYERNRLLFHWSNLIDPGLWTRHLGWLPLRVAVATARRRPLARGFRLARPLWRPAVALRATERAAARVSDREILESFRVG